jgi:excisionase family DNA binding protein
VTDYYTSWDNMPLLLTTDETADILRVHVNTVKYLIRTGRLTATKVGRSWRIPRESVRAMVDCDSDVRLLVRELVAALEPFSRLALPQDREAAEAVVPAQSIERARTVLSRARRLGFEGCSVDQDD